MGYKRITVMDSWEIICRWHSGQNIKHIARTLGYDRKTVRRYIKQARGAGINREEPLPEKDEVLELLERAVKELGRPGRVGSILEPLLPEIISLVNDPHIPLKPKIAYQVLCERHELRGKVSYSSFKRFVRKHRIAISPFRSTCRIEIEAGAEVQIDYGRMGLLFDPLSNRRRTVYAFIATLSHSRHKYVEFTYSQDQQSFVASHVRMFTYFMGGVERVTLDNLKSGVIKPDLYDPRLNRGYREMAAHYGCFIDPCRVSHPKDKGKVERDVQTVRQQFRKLLALHPTMDIAEGNQRIRIWCIDEYGQRDHGTTGLKPYPTFIEKEQPALRQLPDDVFEIATWKEAVVHPHHYIQFKRKTYSIPEPYVGKKVWVKGSEKLIRVYYHDKLIKQHVITSAYRHTDTEDFPENVRAVLDKGFPLRLQKQAARIGPSFQKLIRGVLEPHAFINMRRAQGLLRLAEKQSHKLVEQAAALALEHRLSVTPKLFCRLLEKLSRQDREQDTPACSQQSLEFLRDIDYFARS